MMSKLKKGSLIFVIAVLVFGHYVAWADVNADNKQIHENKDNSGVGNCAAQKVAAQRIICSHPELSKLDIDFQRTVAGKSAALSPEAAGTLAEHQEEFLKFSKCINFPLTRLSDPRVATASQCIAKEYEARQRFILDLPTDVKPKAPYLLSGFERVMLSDGIYNSIYDYDTSDKRSQLIETALRRVFTAISPDTAKYNDGNFYFIEAASDNNLNLIDQGKYLFGSTFERQAGFNHDFIVIDLKTGEVIIAYSTPDALTLMFKTCTNEEFKHYAVSKIREKLDGFETESNKFNQKLLGGKPSPTAHSTIPVVEMKSDGCK